MDDLAYQQLRIRLGVLLVGIFGVLAGAVAENFYPTGRILRLSLAFLGL